MNTATDHPDLDHLPLHVDGVRVRETVRELFRNTENGTPDNISKAGCLALALKSNEVGKPNKGHVVWNAWREAFATRRSESNGADNRADFSREIFSNADPSFAGFNFGDFADFRDSTWTANAVFKGATFGRDSDFSKAKFQTSAHFQGAQFDQYASFEACQFGAEVGQPLPNDPEPCAHFEGAQFAGNANFRNARFYGHAILTGQEWHELRRHFSDQTEFEAARTWGTQHGTTPFAFDNVDFGGAAFWGVANFERKVFRRHGNFLRSSSSPQVERRTTFHRVPRFCACTLYPSMSLEGAVFPLASGNADDARAYRSLKLAFSQQQAVREEQHFFRLEMDEEAQRETGLKRWLFRAYRFFSDYGFSIGKPLVVLLVCAIALGPVHTDAPQWCVPIDSSGRCDIWQPSVWANGFWYGTPLGGIRPTESPIPALQMPGIVLHKTISLAALFLAGLALRNLFKLK